MARRPRAPYPDRSEIQGASDERSDEFRDSDRFLTADIAAGVAL
jgi:hypothetical protein